MARLRLRTREGKRYTQDVVATTVGVERNTVSRWENGSMLPKDPAVIAALARVLSVSVDWLLGEMADESGSPTSSLYEEPVTGDITRRLQEAESLPGRACDLALRYLGRMITGGCERRQIEEAERFLVAGAKNRLLRKPYEARELEEIMADIDAAWDFVVTVLRRQGIRL